MLWLCFCGVSPRTQGHVWPRCCSYSSFPFCSITYLCAFICWFSIIGEEFDPDTGMWMVQPAVTEDGLPDVSVIHLNCIFCVAHLLPIYGDNQIPNDVLCYNSLDAFVAFYINKYADHNAFKIASCRKVDLPRLYSALLWALGTSRAQTLFWFPKIVLSFASTTTPKSYPNVYTTLNI